jgi:hypothetical protein
MARWSGRGKGLTGSGGCLKILRFRDAGSFRWPSNTTWIIWGVVWILILAVLFWPMC